MTGSGSEEIPSGRKMILNSNLGVTNIIERDVIRKDMARVTDSIFDKLKEHYGPYSSFAGLDANKPLEDTVFTKDGANIIKAIEFASPLEDWVRRAISYIGSRMEHAAGDGTTSSMMFACGMLKHMNATIQSMKPLNYNNFYNAWRKFVSEVQTRMNDYVLSAKNSNGEYSSERVRELAYLQAYTSSHGNEELANAMADMFARSPKEMWSKMNFARRNYESDKLFEVMQQTHQYELKADIMSKTVFNKDAGRYLEYPKATFIVINGEVGMDNPFWKIIKEEIEKSNKDNPCVLFCHNSFDNATFGELMNYTSRAKKEDGTGYCLAVFSTNPAHPKINDFTIIQAITGANVMEYSDGEYSDRPLVIRDVYVKYEFEKLELDNLYPEERGPSENIRLRPYYTNPEKPYYREYADTIKKFIDAYDTGDLSLQQQKELKSFQTMYNRLCYDKTLTLVIGGNTFDNLAMFDVVDDCIRATIRTLENGAVVSNNKTLYQVVNEIIQHYESQKNLHKDFSKQEETILWFAENVRETLGTFSNVVMDMVYPNGKSHLPLESNSMFTRIGMFFDDTPTMMFDPTDPLGCSQRRCLSDSFSIMKYIFTREERDSFRRWWFENSVNLLNYNSNATWDQQTESCCTPFRNILKHKYNAKAMVIQPANADIVMLERFGEIALKFILTERVIVNGSAYLKKKEK